jgi:antitoxin (DNA-binding transcriptional repressor) of toxin-antitoxin stability system
MVDQTSQTKEVLTMEISIYNAKTHLSNLIQQLIEEKEDVIYISKNGKPVVQLTLIRNKKSKRLGAAKKEMKDFDLSLDEFNAIPVDEFYGD